MSPIDLSPLIAIHLSPIVAGGVRLSGCLQIHLSPIWRQFICFPGLLVVSGSPFVSPYSNSFVYQSGWWCPALRMPSPSCRQGVPVASIVAALVVQFSTRLPGMVSQLSPRCLPGAVAKMLSPSCFQGFFTCWWVVQLSPRCGLPVVSHMWFPRCCLPVVFQRFYTCRLVFHLSPRCGLQLSPRCGFLDVVSQSGGFELFSRSFADVVSLLSPTCLPDVVSQLSPRCGS